ncbi:MAG: nicotinamide riboside transporter PnuC [Clostridia bacterium]|nr:nicotinamide riboside transporter PnuC [Clostridia bacterium]
MKVLLKKLFEYENKKHIIGKFIKAYGWMFFAIAIMLSISIYLQDTFMGIASSLTGIICVILTAQGKKSCFIYGIINSVLYGIIAYQALYYGDAMLNIFYYTPIQILGWFVWKKNEDRNSGVVVSKRMNRKQLAVLFIVTLSLTIVYGYILFLINGRLPYIDAITTILSIIAFFISIKCYLEQWILWIIVDMISVAMWIYYFIISDGQLVAILIMWLVFLANAIYGYISWLKRNKKNIKKFSENKSKENEISHL